MTKNTVRGLLQVYLEQYLHHLAGKEAQETFIDVVALTSYVIMLFSRVEDFMDYVAVDVFVLVKTRLENHVTIILVDVYGTMSFCHKRTGKKIFCCLSALYVWLDTCVFKRMDNVKCPIEELIRRKSETRGGND